jgi:hypothetical protein
MAQSPWCHSAAPPSFYFLKRAGAERNASTSQLPLTRTGSFPSAASHRAIYTLFAWETVEQGAYMNPDFLRPHKDRGEPVRVDEGNKLNSQLDLIPTSEPAGP